jgi:hypothetical protein
LEKEKQCKKCLRTFPATLEHFYKSVNNKKDGLNSSCKECIKKQSLEWQKENPEKWKDYCEKRDSTEEYLGKRRIKNEELRKNGNYLKWQQENKDRSRIYQHNRRCMINGLRNDLTKDGIDSLISIFGNDCPLTKSKNTELDHFIPVIWGHGGNYIGNVYFLSNNLNKSKHAMNPFEWIKQERINGKVDMNAWNNLVNYLAEHNNMSVYEFKSFVYWCEGNKRTLEEVEPSEKTSIELWLEHK